MKNKPDTILKVALLILLALLCLWFYHCAGQPLPLPPKPKIKLESPKGAEQTYSLRKVPAPVAPLLLVLPKSNTNTLTWTGTYTQSVAFSVEWRLDLIGKWTVLVLRTNLYSYVHTVTNSHGFYRVGAFWP